jgi:glucose/arabinose dehydrogenase
MTIRRSFAALIAIAALLPACSIAQDGPQRSAKHDFRIVTVADGFQVPWGMAWLPTGELLVTERAGRLRMVRNGQLVAAPIAGTPAVRARGQGGMLDVAVHPNFAQNKLVYLSYSKPNAEGTQGTTAVSRGRLEGDRLVDVQEIFEAKAWSNGAGHYGSRLVFDGKGYLFVSLGDRQVPSLGELEKHPAQDLTTHHGKIVRLHEDGRVPTDNPFVSTPGALPEIWSYGHRNVQGMLYDAATGYLWANEHGPQGGDELNLVEAGKNYGWPVIGFGVNYGSGSAIHAGTAREGMQQPRNVWVPSIGISGAALYTGDKFPQWKNSIFVGGLAGQRLVRVTIDGTRALSTELMLERMGRIRDVRMGPDGFVYVAFEDQGGTNPTKIVRLEPVTR